MSDYDEVERIFLGLCDEYGLERPKIGKALPTDRCDVTEAGKVWINCEAADCDSAYHARHLFGHWICDLHAYACEFHEDELSDKVADLIAGLVDGVE